MSHSRAMCVVIFGECCPAVADMVDWCMWKCCIVGMATFTWWLLWEGWSRCLLGLTYDYYSCIDGI